MKIRRQILSILVSACLVAGMLPTVSFAAEDSSAVVGTSGLCGHHTAHDEACGYVEGSEGSPCTHEHGTECYTEVTSCTHIHTEDCYPILGNSVSGNEAVEPAECSHVCSGESGCIVQELNCTHEHDGICGYVPAVEGHPCTYVCGLCGLTEITAWSWVDELEAIDPSSGILALSGAESPVFYDEIVGILPAQITAATENGTETVALGGWSCDNYPAEGADTGSYLFNAVLPDGYTLAENVPALTVTVELGGVAVLDGTEHSSHPICGEAHKDIGDHTGACENVTWTAWDGTSEIPYDADNTAYVYLTGDVTRDETLEVDAYVNTNHTLYLCLNGHSITDSASGNVIFVENSSKLILCDCRGGGKLTHSSGIKGRGVQAGSGKTSLGSATFIMYGGEISGNHTDDDGAGTMISTSDFKMYGGKIHDNNVDAAFNYGGGGVVQLRSNFIMYGGEISSNSSVKYGGGVAALSGSVEINGGVIKNNTAGEDGGGIWTNGSTTIIRGESVAENNRAANGGGVYFNGFFSSHKLVISDSVEIADNTATGDGGGVYYSCESEYSDPLTISDSVRISQNAATNGGGIYIGAHKLTMNGGSITGNTATDNGGGVYFNGSTFKISGGADISGNKKNSASNNVYLTTDKYITIAGELTGGSKIGVTTEATPDSSSYVRIATGNQSYADPEKFLYENDGNLSVSTIINSGTTDLIVCKHNWRSDWSTDSSNHWHVCNICNGIEDLAEHAYNQEVVAEGYKASDATCTSKATYHKSCVCGAKGTETFESGDLNPGNHTGTLGDWKSDGSNHWKEYSCCGAIAGTAAHTGGTADCQNQAVCDICNTAYGDKDISNHIGTLGDWKSDGDEHWKEYSCCGAIAEKAAHTGGTADCQNKAVCDICNTAYGDKDISNHTGTLGDWKSDGDNHWKEYSCCGAIAEKAAHTGGTADCQNRAVCDTCNQPYGNLGSHDPASIWSKDASGHWHACRTANCTEKLDFAAHTPGAAATEETPQTCTECGYELAPALEHTHVWGDWTSNGDGTHTRICSKDSSHTETNSCSGGTATCQTKAVCDTCNQPYGELGSHDPASIWSKDASAHWHVCQTANCTEKLDFAAHTPGAAATEETAQTCTECGYELAPALEHTHVWGEWTSNGDGTHTRICSKDSSHTETNSCSGGTATCQSPAVCATCSQPYGDKDMSNHTGGTEVRGSVEATTGAAGYTGDTYCKGCNTKLADGSTIPKKEDNTGGGGNDRGSDNNTSSIAVTVPVSGDENTIRVDAAVSGTTATIETVELSKLDTVIGNNVKTGIVTIDFSVLEIEVDIVKLPANVVKQISEAVNDPDNDAEGLEIVLTDGTSIEFDAKALDKNAEQANGADITISIKPATDNTLNDMQRQAVGSRPALDINVTSGGRNISDMGGKITIYVPYELRPGERASGIVVYYVDGNGNRESCETGYDPVKKRVTWETNHFSVYMIGYDESVRKSPATGDDDPVYVTYTVQKGDTLWAIARKYGCTVSEIVAANSELIKNPNLIYKGWQLQIPQDETMGADSADAILPDNRKTGVYIVKRGDTLWAISRKYGCTVAEIVGLNGELIADPDLIFAGWELEIPQN